MDIPASVLHQVEEWAKGNALHNYDRDECTPDFACCAPDLLATEPTRLAYRDAFLAQDIETLENYNRGFLSALAIWNWQEQQPKG